MEMKPYLLIVAVCYSFNCHADGSNQNVPYYQQLIRETLLAKYDRLSCPISDTGAPVNVSILLFLFNILDVNIAQQTLTLKQWFRMIWKDPNLQWNPALYGGVDNIMVQRNTIWLPDIIILGKISLTELPDKLSIARVSSDGTVFYFSDQVATVSCEFDVVDFPYDTQNCSLHFSSWMYGANEIVLTAEPANLDDFVENDEWTLRSCTSRSLFWANATTFFYDIKITRKPDYYITTFVWPSFIINCLSIIGIFSPFNDSGEREEKVTMGLTTLLTMAVILMIIAGDLPRSANGVSLLGLFIMIEIAIAAFASVFSVFIMHLHSNWMKGTRVPHWLLQSTCTTRKKDKTKNITSTQQAFQNNENTEPESLFIENVGQLDNIGMVLVANNRDPKPLVSVARGVQTINPPKNIGEDKSEALREQWNTVAARFDLVLMVIFLVLNVLTCVGLLVIGNSKLNK